MNKMTMILLSAIMIVMALIASRAFANDTQTVSGAGNIVTQDSNNIGGSVYSGTGAGGHITNTANGGAGGSAKAYGGNANQHQSQYQGQGQSQSSHSSVKGSGNSDNSYVAEAQKRNPVASAASNFLTSSGDCIGSAGVGGQFVGFGLSAASTTSPSDCNRRADAAYWQKANEPVIAMARMCQDETNRDAIHAAGKVCPDETSVKPATRRLSSLAPASKGEEFPTDKKRFE